MRKRFTLIFIIVGSLAVFIVLIVGIVRVSYPLTYIKEVKNYSEKYDLEVSFVLAVIKNESSFKKNALSSAGAVGLMQIMPETAIWIASVLEKDDYKHEDLFEIETNIEFGCFYLNYLSKQFENRNVVLCAYNLGETSTRKILNNTDGFESQIVEYTETYNFINRVNKSAEVYKMII